MRWVRRLLPVAAALCVLAVAPVASAATLTSDQVEGIALGEQEFALAAGNPDLLDPDTQGFNYTVAESDFAGDLPSTADSAAKEFATAVFDYEDKLGQVDWVALGEQQQAAWIAEGQQEYADLEGDGIVEDRQAADALATGSVDVTSGALPDVLAGAALDTVGGALVGAAALGPGVALQYLIAPDAAGVLQMQQANGVANGSATGYSLRSNVQSDGSDDGCVRDGGNSAASWVADCSGLQVNGGQDGTLIPAPGPGPWDLVTWTTPNTSAGSVSDWPVASNPGDVCASPSFALGAPFLLGVGANNQTCEDANTAQSDPATLEGEFLPPGEVGTGPMALEIPPTGAPAAVAGSVTVPSWGDLLARITQEYGSGVPADDFGKGLVAAVNGGKQTDGSTGTGPATPLSEAESGDALALSNACDGMTVSACVTLLDSAGYAASDGGDLTSCQAPQAYAGDLYQSGVCGTPNNAGVAIGGVAPGGAVALETPVADASGLGSPGSASNVYWPVDGVTPLGSPMTVSRGAPVTVYGEPQHVSPDCASGAQTTGSFFKWLDPVGYPTTFAACQAALEASGVPAGEIVEEPLQGSMWDWYWGCGSDPCDAGDPANTVEWVTGSDPVTYDGTQTPEFDWGLQYGQANNLPVYVFVDGYSGPLVDLPPYTWPTTTDTTTTDLTTTGTTTVNSTATDTTTTQSTGTGTTTTQSTGTGTTTTQSTGTGTTTTQSTGTGTTTTQSTGTGTTTTQSTDTGTTTTQSTDTGTTTTPTTTTPTGNCVVDDTCDPPTPFTDGGPATIHFPEVATPCNVFPFGVPCFVAQQVEALNAPPVAPSFTIALPTGPHSAPISHTFNLGDLPVSLQDAFAVARWFFLFFTVIGVVMWLTRRHGGSPPDGGSGEDRLGSEGDGL